MIIGAAATFSEVMESPLVNQTAPLLAEACRQVGAVQIRNMGTLGGNVANAAACADSLPALICLDASARILTAQGEQELPVVGSGGGAQPDAPAQGRAAGSVELSGARCLAAGACFSSSGGAMPWRFHA